jgi:flagellar assembly factor FliW
MSQTVTARALPVPPTAPFPSSGPHPAPRTAPSERPAVDAIAFPDGIPGFEACRQFVLLASEALAPLQRIDAIDGPAASFLCIDPSHVVPGYAARPTPGDLQRLDATTSTRLLWLALVAVEPDGTVVANLRAPIAINPDRMIGRQILPNDSTHPIRHVLMPADS